MKSTRSLPSTGVRSDLHLFDRQPFEIDGFRFTATGIEVVGKPKIVQWQAAYQFACAAEHSSPFWVAKLLRYLETRQDWQQKKSQVIALTGLALRTVENRLTIAKQVGDEELKVAPSFSHAAEVANLTKYEQSKWLHKAAEEGWSVAELRINIRASKRRRIIEGQASLEGRYRVVYADPPWAYDNRGDITVGKSSAYKRAEAHYPTMTIEELCALPIASHAAENAVLFLWVTSPLLMQNPGPREVIEAWGFEYKSSFVWDKVLGNFGHYNHVCHEFLLVCTRGSCLPDVPVPAPKSVIHLRRSDTHSEKPEEVRQMIMRGWTVGPYLELFARKRTDGWTCYGNDAQLAEVIEA